MMFLAVSFGPDGVVEEVFDEEGIKKATTPNEHNETFWGKREKTVYVDSLNELFSHSEDASITRVLILQGNIYLPKAD